MPDFKLGGGCLVEAVSACFPNSASDSELARSAQLMEYEFFRKQSENIIKKQSNYTNFGVSTSHLSKKLKFYMCPAVLIESESFIGPHLTSLSDNRNVKSVRQILNQNPDWPRQSVNHENMLKNREWISGFKKLNDLGTLSFEIHLNPHQFIDMAEVVRDHGQNISSYIINHLGTLTLSDLSLEDISNESEVYKKRIQAYFENLQVLKNSHPKIFVKMSYLHYFHENWHVEPVYSKLGEILKRVFEMFGKDKMIYASNFPLDRWSRDLVERKTVDWMIENYVKILREFVFVDKTEVWTDLDYFFGKNGRVAYRV